MPKEGVRSSVSGGVKFGWCGGFETDLEHEKCIKTFTSNLNDVTYVCVCSCHEEIDSKE
jgi:hypothetical protein